LQNFIDERVEPAPIGVGVARDVEVVGDALRAKIGDDDGDAARRQGPRRRIADADRLAAAGDQRDTRGVGHDLLIFRRGSRWGAATLLDAAIVDRHSTPPAGRPQFVILRVRPHEGRARGAGKNRSASHLCADGIPAAFTPSLSRWAGRRDVHRLIRTSNRQILGIYHWISEKYIDRYLDGFTWCYNRQRLARAMAKTRFSLRQTA
jgi:hypothetical protein